jgi:disulfide bond formation protein DsbB
LNNTARKGNACEHDFRRRGGSAMIRFLFRFIGLLLLACGFVLLVYDGTKSIANQHMYYSTVDYVWAMIDQNSLKLVQAWVRQKALWAEPYAVVVFELPTWAVLAFLALILILLGRRKKPLIGYARE